MYCNKYNISREQSENLSAEVYKKYFNSTAAKKYTNLQIITAPPKKEDATHVYLTIEEKMQELFAKDRGITVHDNF